MPCPAATPYKPYKGVPSPGQTYSLLLSQFDKTYRSLIRKHWFVNSEMRPASLLPPVVSGLKGLNVG